jgi:hypothetical protein
MIMISTLLFLVPGYALGGRYGLFIALLAALGWNYLLFLHKPVTPIQRLRAQHQQGRDTWDLLAVIDTFKDRFRLPQVGLYITEEPEVLFLVGSTPWHQPTLLLSRAALQCLTPGERQALIVLGLSTLKHRRAFGRYFLERLALTWIEAGRLADLLLPFRDLRLASILTGFIAWLHLRLAFSPTLQAKADLLAYQTIQHSRDLATALWKLHGAAQIQKNNRRYSDLYCSVLEAPPFGSGAFQFILPIELRLRYLVGYYPI